MITQSTRDILTSNTILQKLREVQSGRPWYGKSVDELLCCVEPRVAFSTVPHMPHSIASLLAHMIFWKQYVLDIMSGNDTIRDQEQSFSWKGFGKPSAETWEKMVSALRELNHRIYDHLDNNHVDPYDEVPGTRYNQRMLLEGIVEHDIYHIGQIALLSKYFRRQTRSQSLFRFVKGLAM